ncbi:MAG: hypothetical protein FWF36_01445 [Propionibacteriaceae bacterium]|nr:hypothetical protein [Propionibacteriaceae bacterium]
MKKKAPVTNIIVAVLWVVLGILALSAGYQLALFGLIPINGVLVIIIGIVWLAVTLFSWLRPQQPTAAVPAYQPGQMPPTTPPGYGPGQMPPITPPSYGPGATPGQPTPI